MSPASDSCRAKTARGAAEVLDSVRAAARAIAWHEHCKRLAPPMRIPSAVFLLVCSALGALASAELAWAAVAPPRALLLSAVLACALGLALLRRRPQAVIADRSAVRLALRLARPGQQVVLVEMPAGYRVLPLDAAARRRGQLEILASRSRGALLLARERG